MDSEVNRINGFYDSRYSCELEIPKKICIFQVSCTSTTGSSTEWNIVKNLLVQQWISCQIREIESEINWNFYSM